MTATAQHRPSFGSRLGNALLTVAAAGGALCIVLVLLAVVFNITLIMFKTGSMSPTIPAGSLAVVKEIPAAEVAVGDVVTVDRLGALPITHRVTSVAAADGESRSITMRGDANEADDAAPYLVDTVRIVLFSFPELAYLVSAASTPQMLGGITLGATLLVTWAFWPREEPRAPRSPRSPRYRARHSVDQTARHAAGNATGNADGPAAGPATRHGAKAGSVLAVVLLAAGSSIAGAPPAAHAATTEQIIEGTVMTLTSVGDGSRMSHLVPTVAVPWQVGVDAYAGEPGIVRLSLSAAGELSLDPQGLHVAVRACDVRWVNDTCAAGETTTLALGPVSAFVNGERELLTIAADEELWLLIDVSLPANPIRIPDATATLTLTADGSGDVVSVGSDVSAIARTGSDLRPALFTAVFAVLGGVVLAALARISRPRPRRVSRSLDD
ncbi:signal peptidase I [Salinibacterium sp. SWN1162]|uniref:signal peptidase I n=1 Tax=Salinibacterium sp. SWN1162 TaxID=2792053 RepID=UPI0018CEE795|nr:signal peptidase I [Salinibacterium sp. SWN1162]MBH0007834.1 signal peptidase I [Salinibacterium sp. SWN1162]